MNCNIGKHRRVMAEDSPLMSSGLQILVVTKHRCQTDFDFHVPINDTFC